MGGRALPVTEYRLLVITVHVCMGIDALVEIKAWEWLQ